MKKTAAVIAIVALAAVSAVAYPGGGFRGQGGPCYGNGFGGGPGMMGGGFGPGAGAPCYGNQQQAIDPIDDAGAKAKVQEYIDGNFKGFSIVDGSKIEVPRGAMYQFDVKDSNGNLFIFRVNPFGAVRGPIPAKAVK
jgi:hypothetical protein